LTTCQISFPSNLHFQCNCFRNCASGFYYQVRLSKASCAERQLLLHGRFQFYDVTAHDLPAKSYRATNPFVLAAAFGSIKCCDVMIHSDVSAALSVEPGSLMNVMHCLACVVVFDPELEPLMVETYQHLCSILPTGVLRRLLRMENSDSIRPLEFAIQQVKQ